MTTRPSRIPYIYVLKGMDSDTRSEAPQTGCQNAWEHAEDLAGRCMRSARAVGDSDCSRPRLTYCTVVQNRRDSMYTYIRSGTCTQSIVWELRTSPRNVLLQIAVLVVQNRRELHGPQEMYCCTSPIDSVPDFA